MAKIYAVSCMRDGKNFFDVPVKLQDKVRFIIEAEGYEIQDDGTVIAAATTTSSEEEI